MTPLQRRSALVSGWVVAAVVLGALLAVADAANGPLDDPDPAHQRPGILDVFGLPADAPPLAGGAHQAGRPTVVFFERSGRVDALCSALESSQLPEVATLVLVVHGAGSPVRCHAVTVLGDGDGDLARRVGLRRPADGGPPVGYVIIDAGGRIRYRTLDPSVADELGEVRTMVDATR